MSIIVEFATSVKKKEFSGATFEQKQHHQQKKEEKYEKEAKQQQTS